MPSRTITARNRSKHIGHAAEGHLRGLLLHLPGVDTSLLTRSLPMHCPVENDAVLLDDSGKVRVVVVVTYWDHAGSSEKKLYRTRTEFIEICRAVAEHPTAFAEGFKIFTVVYGSEGGWKEQVLQDLLRECAPGIFLPREIGKSKAEQVVSDAFREYCAHWQKGRSDARDHVESSVAGRALTSAETRMLSVIAGVIKGTSGVVRGRADVRTKARLPNVPVTSRYRQALGLLSLFPNEEINEWLRYRDPFKSALVESFARRACLLDVGGFKIRPAITLDEGPPRSVISFQLRAPTDERGEYAPERPDFVSWQAMPFRDLAWILDAHRAKVTLSRRVFAGGAFDQCFGNFGDIGVCLNKEGKALVRALRKGDISAASATIAGGSLTTAEPWNPACRKAWLSPLWSLSASALALAHSERGLRGTYDARRQTAPSAVEAKRLAKALASSRDAVDAISDASEFAGSVASAPIEEVAALTRPKLFQLDEPCSWVADGYMTLTTNASHNPLNELLVRWLKKRYPKVLWQGWPQRRSVPVSEVIPGARSRRQWCVLGIEGDTVIGAEVKSVTANNWGNKSKELYDRVTDLRRNAAKKNLKSTSILLFDGDLSTDIAEELASGIGHDEIWTVDEVLKVLSQTVTSCEEILV